jgi:hypothetical protein
MAICPNASCQIDIGTPFALWAFTVPGSKICYYPNFFLYIIWHIQIPTELQTTHSSPPAQSFELVYLRLLDRKSPFLLRERSRAACELEFQHGATHNQGKILDIIEQLVNDTLLRSLDLDFDQRADNGELCCSMGTIAPVTEERNESAVTVTPKKYISHIKGMPSSFATMTAP